jgi:NAD-dependent deacetylase
MNVYPAAGLINYVSTHAPIYIIDPNEVPVAGHPRIKVIRENAGEGVHIFSEEIKNVY